METTYFYLLPSEILYINLTKLFDDPIVYYLIEFFNLNPSKAFRLMSIEIVSMLRKFGENFTFRYRKISWMAIYEGLISNILCNIRLDSEPTFDDNFVLNQDIWESDHDRELINPYVCDDFFILMIYHYTEISKGKFVEKNDPLFICEYMILTHLFDKSMIIANPLIIVTLHNFEIYRDVVVELLSSYQKHRATYIRKCDIQSYSGMIKLTDYLKTIASSEIYYDPRTGYAFKYTSFGYKMIGIYTNPGVRKLTKDEIILAKALDYHILW